MTTIDNLAISASAGSGKTFQLAHRYIRLMAEGVAPERIVALTFSRKAAGEILASIIENLCSAAASEDGADQTARHIRKASCNQAFFLSCLQRLLRRLHRVHVGTLDSFIVGVVRAFPLELGIGTELDIMDEGSAPAQEANRRVLARIFNSRELDAAARKVFLEALRQATFGHEEKGLERVLENLIGKYRPFLRTAPDAGAWGDETKIWSEAPCPWLAEPAGDVAAAAEALRRAIGEAGWPAEMKAALSRFVDFSENYDEFSQWDDPLFRGVLIRRLIAAGSRLRDEAVEVSYRRQEHRIGAEQARLLFRLFCRVFGTELTLALKRTRGIHGFLGRYERRYDELVRRAGGLTFADAQCLLTAGNEHSGGAQMSRRPDALLYIDYRLDCELDHWLLDEFQDTSDLQWETLRNLADEILQDASGARSFFYVGDVKQAIYGWRGGNPRLFGRILQQYGTERIHRQTLAKSYRSCQAVIDTVNRVFATLPEGIPGVVRERWAAGWKPHECAGGHVPPIGGVALLEPIWERDDGKPGAEDRYHVVAALLNEIKPATRGLSAAVLVRSNKAGKDVVELLRNECPGLPVLHEGEAAIKDNPVVTLFLSLVRFAAHPGDTLAWRHLQMSPLNQVFAGLTLNAASLPVALLREIEASGFQGLIRHWSRRLQEKVTLEAYERKRLNDLIVAAGEFDAAGSRDGDAFLRFVDGYEVREFAGKSAVRVMTVHQAKGLEFDVVFLPDLQPPKDGDMRRTGQDFLVSRAAGADAAEWVLKMPRRLVAESDPVLAKRVAEADEAACYEELCVVYVALTRAKRGLYIVTSPQGEGSEALTPGAFLKMQLAGDPNPKGGSTREFGAERAVCLYVHGDLDWCGAVERPPPPPAGTAEAEWPADFTRRPSRRTMLGRVEPSAREAVERNAAWLFARESRDVLDFGSAIHALFEHVAWIEDADSEAIVRAWAGRCECGEEVKRDAAGQFRAALKAAEVRAALARPKGDAELWREKRFDAVFDQNWVSGTFDRVTILRDGAGQAASAEILDYKSDRVEHESALKEAVVTYRGQLDLYRRALAGILRVPPSRITTRLLFTRIGRVLTVG